MKRNGVKLKLLFSRTILFVTSYYNHLRCFIPVIAELKRKGAKCVVAIPEDIVIGEEQIKKSARENNIKIIKMKTNPYTKKRSELSRGERLLTNNFYIYFYLKKQVEMTMHKIDPDLLVVGHDLNHPERYFVRYAKENNIPSLLIAHAISSDFYFKEYGLAPWWKPNIFIRPDQNSLKINTSHVLNGIYRLFLTNIMNHPLKKIICAYGGGETTKVAYWGSYQKKIWVKWGGDPNKMEVTGYPGYDVLFQKYKIFDDEIKKQMLNKLGIVNNNKIILFTTQSTVEERIQTLEERKKFTVDIVGETFKVDKVILIVKVHPKQEISEYDYLKGSNNKKVIIVQDFELHDLILISDLLITHTSTTAMDAILCNKPVITVNFKDTSEPYPYASSGAAIGVYQKRKLKNAVEGALYDEKVQKELVNNRSKFIDDHIYKFDGKSTKRVIDLIEQIILKCKNINN